MKISFLPNIARLIIYISAIISILFLIQWIIVQLFVPQFVLLSWDGGNNIIIWKESLDFARENEINYTYFINGAYLIEKGMYNITKSRIDFGDNKIEERVILIKTAYNERHGIASHGTTHENIKSYKKELIKNDFLIMQKIFYGINITLRGYRAPFLS